MHQAFTADAETRLSLIGYPTGPGLLGMTPLSVLRRALGGTGAALLTGGFRVLRSDCAPWRQRSGLRPLHDDQLRRDVTAVLAPQLPTVHSSVFIVA